ncbi:MAG: type I 3-dehydroquinate dehydratase [Treponema sp.]|nr:type I 3-dehydroquinate dehydratase [Treponema sp.]
MAKICLCLTAPTIEKNLDTLKKYRGSIDLAELRVDFLAADERLRIRHFPKLAGLPVILTIRRDIDGGKFTGGEGSRIKLLAQGLAYAEADTRNNFAYVDIEDDLDVPSLEEAARTFGTRIIRSYHNINGTDINISAKIKSMQRVENDIIKIAVTAKSTAEVLKVYRASRSFQKQDKILVCMGHLGVCTRILAERFGSVFSYSSALSENETAAAGQIDARELADLYRMKKIGKNTKIFAVAGFPLETSYSPAFFNKVFGLEDADAVCVPFPTDSITNFLELAKALKIQGISVAAPYKEAVLPHLARMSAVVQSIGACNTMSLCTEGWFGENTDAPGFSDSILGFLGKKKLRWKKITIIGAGGAAKTVAAEVHRLGGKCLILNRTAHKARSIALPYNFQWEGLDNRGIDLMGRYSDMIIQTTPAGTQGSDAVDPLEAYTFTGREDVVDLVFNPTVTPFLKRAHEAGCRTINGYDMFIHQACLQYALFMGREFPRPLLSRINPG